MRAGTPTLRRAIRPLAWVLIPGIFWIVSWAEYRVPTLLFLPLLLFLSTPMLGALIALHAAVVVVMAFAYVPQPPNVLLAGSALLGLWFGFRRALFAPVPGRAAARIAVPMRWLALIAAIALPVFTLFRGFPWPAYLLLAAGYCALFRYLQPFAPVLVKSRRTAAANAVLVFAATIFGFALLELGARYFIKLPPPQPSLQNMMVADDHALWAPRPNFDMEMSYLTPSGERVPFTLHHSSQGLRGDEVPPKQPGEFRVLMLGDSFTYGWNVSQGEDVPSQLQEILRAAHPNEAITVINMGVPAYAPWQALELLKARGLAFAPDLVILQLFPANDITESLTKFGRTLPAFGQWETHKMFTWWQQQDRAYRLERWLRTHSAAYNVLRESGFGGRGIPGIVYRFRLTRGTGAINVDTGAARTYWLEALRTQWYPELTESWTECQKDVIAIAETCRTNNIEFLAYAIPLNIFSDAQWQSAFDESSRKAGEHIEYEAYRDTKLMEEFFAANKLPWMPLLEPLQATVKPDAYFIPGDGHLNSEGCRFVARLLAEQLAAQGL